MQNKQLTGFEKASIFLMNLEQNDAAEILKHLSATQIEKLGLTMSSMQNIEKDSIDSVNLDFLNSMKEQTSVGGQTDEYIKGIITNALGEKAAVEVLNSIGQDKQLSGLESLKWMDSKEVFNLIKLLHPQIQAVVLSYLGGVASSKVLAYFDRDESVDLITRIANLKNINPEAVKELNLVLENNNSKCKNKSINGLETAAEILNHLEADLEAIVMDNIRENDSKLSRKIEDLMFVFDDLVKIDNIGMQKLLRELSTKQLLLALKGASESVKRKIYSNLSDRAAGILKDDLKAMLPVRIIEVERAQKQIIGIAKHLAKTGELNLNNKNTKEMI